jgi:hypothetical protein
VSNNDQLGQKRVKIPEGCPDVDICDFADAPTPNSSVNSFEEIKKELKDQNKTLDPKTQAPQIRANNAEIRGINHNSKDNGPLKNASDISCKWKCNTCEREFEIDHVLRNDEGNITGFVEVKSGAPLRGPQAEIHKTLAQQKSLQYFKKVQHKGAIKKCKNKDIPFIDMTSTPAP